MCCNDDVVRVGLVGTLLLALSQVPTPVEWRTIPIDSYPADARAQIGAARETALRRPTDADAVGQLALVLHAWEQFELAAAA